MDGEGMTSREGPMEPGRIEGSAVRDARRRMDARRGLLEGIGALDVCADAVEASAAHAVEPRLPFAGDRGAACGGLLPRRDAPAPALDIAVAADAVPSARNALAWLAWTGRAGMGRFTGGPPRIGPGARSLEQEAQAFRLVRWLRPAFDGYGRASAGLADVMAAALLAAGRDGEARGAALRAVGLDADAAALSWDVLGTIDMRYGCGDDGSHARMDVDGLLRPMPRVHEGWVRADGMPSACTWLGAMGGAISEEPDDMERLLFQTASALAARFARWGARVALSATDRARLVLDGRSDPDGNAVRLDLEWLWLHDTPGFDGLGVSWTTGGSSQPHAQPVFLFSGDGRLRPAMGFSDRLACAVGGWLLRDLLDGLGDRGRMAFFAGHGCSIGGRGADRAVLRAGSDGIHGRIVVDGVRMDCTPQTEPAAIAAALGRVLGEGGDGGRLWPAASAPAEAKPPEGASKPKD